MVNPTADLVEWLQKKPEEADTDLPKRGDELDGGHTHGRRGGCHLRGEVPGEIGEARELEERASAAAPSVQRG